MWWLGCLIDQAHVPPARTYSVRVKRAAAEASIDEANSFVAIADPQDPGWKSASLDFFLCRAIQLPWAMGACSWMPPRRSPQGSLGAVDDVSLQELGWPLEEWRALHA